MKTLKVSLKAIVFILATGMVLTSATANATIKNNIKTSEGVVSIAHAGLHNNQPLVQLSFDNISGEKVFISMKDENGIVVYTEVFSGKAYSKKFLFEKDLADANPVITVTYSKLNKTEKYLVNSRENAAGSVNITKL